MKTKFFIWLFVFYSVISYFISAQHINSVRKPSGDEFWYILKQAQNAYDSAEYGNAIKLAENAKQKKKEIAEWESFVLDQTQKNYKVRKAGDYLEEILPVLKDKSYDDAVSIINKNIDSFKLSSSSKFMVILSSPNPNPPCGGQPNLKNCR